VDKVLDSRNKRTSFGAADDGDAASSPKLKQLFIAEDS
jgi:hypothetical protein